MMLVTKCEKRRWMGLAQDKVQSLCLVHTVIRLLTYRKLVFLVMTSNELVASL
jgi:hypothetical protein